jgi:hypothetical protein
MEYVIMVPASVMLDGVTMIVLKKCTQNVH